MQMFEITQMPIIYRAINIQSKQLTINFVREMRINPILDNKRGKFKI
jgi:hypothetical protein